MIKIAYLILSHNNPNHFRRLIRSISSEYSSLFIHIDQKSNINDFLSVQKNGVYFIKNRLQIYYSDWSQIEATLALLRYAINCKNSFDYYVLLSGTDYPLQSNSYINDFFQNNSGLNFINMVKMPCEEVGKPEYRLSTYRQRSDDHKIEIISRKFFKKIGFIPQNRDYKRHLRGLIPYGGSQWFALTKQACRYILEFSERRKKIVNFFENSFTPSEMFFQTILGNSSFNLKTANNLTYTDWSAGSMHPATLSEKHIDLFNTKGKIMYKDVYGEREILFARKFSDEKPELVDRLDKIIQRKQNIYRLE